jgi:acetylornithine deacetylase/succinyl-diaminopimelate desuccinylase-like protein
MNSTRSLGLLLSLAALAGPASNPLAAQDATPVVDPEGYQAELEQLAGRAQVARALQLLVDQDEQTIRDLVELTEIPAPPFMEEVRARDFLERLRALGVDSAWVDDEGNVLALRRGSGGGTGEGPVLALTGHLDTVFPEGTDVTVTVRGDTLYAPGIADDTRGLATLLAVLRVMNEAGIRTVADVLFVGTVGEEGLGDLRGVKHLFREGGPRIDAFLSIDGTSDTRITHQGLGSHRYRVTFQGPGGHSWGAFGLANPAHALGRAAALFDDAATTFTAAAGARTSFNVGRIGGGTSVNSIPFEAWMEVDMRSESPAALGQIDALLHEAVEVALVRENEARRDGDPLTVDMDMIGDRPSGEVALDEPLVQRAVAATHLLGLDPELGRSSTDSNVPISLGVPAVTLGGGGASGATHSPDEWYLNDEGPRGIQRVLLIVLAQAGVATAS